MEVTNSLTNNKKQMTVTDFVKGLQSEFQNALPKVLTPERFTRIALTALSNTPELKKCTATSLMGGLMQAAQLGLEPNTPLGQAYLIPYKNKGVLECQFQVGYKGMLDLAYRSENMQTVQAYVVYQNDKFEYELGLDPKLKHIPATSNRGEAIYVYAVFKTSNGGYGFEVMSIDDVKEHGKKYSKSFSSQYSPWTTNFEEMAKKTAIKKVLKYAPLKTEFATAIAVDEGTIKASNDSEIPLQVEYQVNNETEETQDSGKEEKQIDNEIKNKSLDITKVNKLSNMEYLAEDILTATNVNLKLGVKFLEDEEYEYIDYGEFVVYDKEEIIEKRAKKIYLYDHMIDTHIKYDDEPLQLNYSEGDVRVVDLLQAICNKFDFTLKTLSFVNSEKIIEEDKYLGLNLTYRDILDEISATAGGYIKIFNKDLYVAYPTETGEIIDEYDLEKLTINNLEGPYNTLVLGRTPQEDNILWPEGIPDEERISVRIDNNQIMDKDRKNYIVDIYEKIKNFSYTTLEIQSFGFGYFEFGDIVTVKDLKGNYYRTYIQNVNIKITSGIKEKIFVDKTNFSETKYQYATSMEKRLKNAEIIVDKQEGKINNLVSHTNGLDENITNLLLEKDKILSSVSETKEDVEILKTKTLEIEQNSSQYEMRFITFEEAIEQLNKETSDKNNELIKYIRFVNGILELGQNTNQLKVQLSNEKLSFFDGSKEVAYVSNSKLYITDTEILGSLKIINFGFFSRSNGSLSFKKWR